MKQILYHGGSHIIQTPEIREPERTLDFGKGFYVTSSQNQAERWLKAYTPVAQYLFHTERSLAYLRYLSNYAVIIQSRLVDINHRSR